VSVRLFDDIDDKITLALGAVLGTAFGPAAIGAIVKRANNGDQDPILHVGGISGSTRYGLYIGTGGLIEVRVGSTVVSAPTLSHLAADGWVYIGAKKASGVAAPRFSKYNFATSTWSHENAASSVANSGVPTGSAAIGAFTGGTTFFDGLIGIIGLVFANPSDAAIEAVIQSQVAWETLFTSGSWPLTQASTGTAVVDTTGNGADQTAIVGTTVDPNVIPWTAAAQIVSISSASTTDTPQPLTYTVTYSLDPATTTDQAQPLSYSVANPPLSLVPATTTDQAQPLSVRSVIVVVTRPPARPTEILGDWIFELARSDDLEKVGRLTEAKSRSLTLTQDRAGSLSMSLPLTHRLSREVEIARTCVLAKKGGQVVWSGPVWTLEKSAPGDLSIGCVGWLQTLGKRVTKPSWIADGKLSYASTDAGLIAHSVLDRSAEDVADGPIYVTSGGLETTQLRTETYQPFNSVLSIITGLSAEEIEAGYFINVHPVARTLDIYATIGRVRPQAVFTYGSSAATISQAFDADRLCNRFIAYSAIGWAQADNLISQAVYGVFEEAQALADVRSLSILQAYANGEIAVRSDPLGFLAFTGAPSTLDGPRVPRIFEDFVIGDTVQVAGRHGALDVPRQPTRVYSATLNWPDKGGREILSSVQTIASGS
jgi:hypothetical protein